MDFEFPIQFVKEQATVMPMPHASSNCQPLASFISERSYFTKKNLPTVTVLKSRLQKTSLPKLQATLMYLQQNRAEIMDGIYEDGWHGHGMDGGSCRWRSSRLHELHSNRLAALDSVIDTKLREKEKKAAKKEKAKERKKANAKAKKEKLKIRKKEKAIAKKQRLKERKNNKAKKARA